MASAQWMGVYTRAGTLPMCSQTAGWSSEQACLPSASVMNEVGPRPGIQGHPHLACGAPGSSFSKQAPSYRAGALGSLWSQAQDGIGGQTLGGGLAEFLSG